MGGDIGFHPPAPYNPSSVSPAANGTQTARHRPGPGIHGRSADRLSGEESDRGKDSGGSAQRRIAGKGVERSDGQVAEVGGRREQEASPRDPETREHRREGEDPGDQIREEVTRVRVQKEGGRRAPELEPTGKHRAAVKRAPPLQSSRPAVLQVEPATTPSAQRSGTRKS